MKCPNKCPICGAGWIGGHCKPGEKVMVGLRTFFNCGASMSIKDSGWPEYRGDLFLMVKNCTSLEELYGKEKDGEETT